VKSWPYEANFCLYKYKGLEGYPEIKYAISEVADGNMSYLWGDKNEVLKNRKAFLSKNDIDINKAVTVRTKDTTIVTAAFEKDFAKGMFEVENAIQVDGMLTMGSGLTLFLVVADCSPVIIYDKQKKVFGLIHINRNVWGYLLLNGYYEIGTFYPGIICKD
jgi:hypothetical protein